MVEPAGHCPYLGLKQNRAIRFSSPTPEHRCYVGGEPIEIPVDQASFCLARGHVECPLYMGLGLPTTPVASQRSVTPQEPAEGSLRGWLASLSPRDRAVYALMLAMLALIVVIYVVAGFQSLRGQSVAGLPSADALGTAPASPEAPSPIALETPTSAPPEPTAAPPELPTALPTSAPPEPTAIPTRATLILPPTEPAPPPSPSPEEATVAPSPTAEGGATATAAVAPTEPAPPTQPPTQQPTQQATNSAPAPTAPPANVSTEVLWLYFTDPATRSLYVPVQRSVQVVDRRVAEAAVRELIAGPRGDLERLVLPDVRLLGITIQGNTAFVNFDRPPTDPGDDRGVYSIVLTLTNLPNIEQVQVLVNGQGYGVTASGPIRRPIVNPLNPEGLPFDYQNTEYLPTYYMIKGSDRSVRIMRMVPKTRETAVGTVQALLEGPGEYSYAVDEVIPDTASLLDLWIENGVVTVNFSERFTDATNREAAVRTIVESLTTLPGVTGVRFLVEGESLAGYWGEPYRDVFTKPLINPE